MAFTNDLDFWMTIDAIMVAGHAPKPKPPPTGGTTTGRTSSSNPNFGSIPPRGASPQPDPPPSRPSTTHMSEDSALPKQELLKKILGQTTSDNDNIALMAIRKVNTLLAENGWTWDRLIDGKIRVAENPFANLKKPPPSAASNGYAPEPPDHPAPPQPKRPAPPPRPTPPPRLRLYTDLDGNNWPTQQDCDNANQAIRRRRQQAATPPKPSVFPTIGSQHSNKFANNCHCCGDWVDQQMGFIWKPFDHGVAGWPKSKWSVVCKPCNNATNVTLKTAAAPKRGGPATLADLA